MPKKRLEFTGTGFSKEPMTPEELAKARERSRHYEEHFLCADDFVNQMGLRWVVNMAKGTPAFLKAMTAAGVVSGFFLMLSEWGIL